MGKQDLSVLRILDGYRYLTEDSYDASFTMINLSLRMKIDLKVYILSVKNLLSKWYLIFYLKIYIKNNVTNLLFV